MSMQEVPEPIKTPNVKLATVGGEIAEGYIQNPEITEAEDELKKLAAQNKPAVRKIEINAEVSSPLLNKGTIDALTARVQSMREGNNIVLKSVAKTDRIVANNIELEKIEDALAAQPTKVQEPLNPPEGTSAIELAFKEAGDKEKAELQVKEAEVRPPTEKPVGYDLFKNPKAETNFSFLKKEIKEDLPHTFIGDAGAALNRLGIRVAHAPFIATYEKFYQWRHGRTVDKVAKLETIKNSIKIPTEQLSSIDALIEKHKKEGTYTPQNARLIESGRSGYVKTIEGLEKQADTMRRRVEKSSNKDAYWLNRKKHVAEKAIDLTESGAHIHVVKLDELKTKNMQLEAQLDLSNLTKERETAALLELKKKLANKQASPEESLTVQVIIDQIEQVLAENREEYSRLRSENRRILSQMNKSNDRISTWKNEGNKYTRIGNRTHQAQDGTHESVELDSHHEYNLSHAPEAAETTSAEQENAGPAEKAAASEVSGSEPTTPQTPTTPESSERLNIKPELYINKWNALKVEMAENVQPEVFASFAGIKLGQDTPIEKLEAGMITMVTAGLPKRFHRYTIEGMKGDFNKIRKTLAQAA